MSRGDTQPASSADSAYPPGQNPWGGQNDLPGSVYTQPPYGIPNPSDPGGPYIDPTSPQNPANTDIYGNFNQIGPSQAQPAYTMPNATSPLNPNYNAATDPAAKLWGFEQAKAYNDVIGGLTDAQTDISSENALWKIGLANAQGATEAGYLNTNADVERRRLGLKGQGIDLQKQGNQIDIGANARQPGFLTHLHDIAGRGFDLNRQQNVAQNRQGNFQLFNQSVGAGNVLMGGYNVQRNELAQQLMRNQVGVNLSQEEETAKYGENMARTEDERQKLQLTNKQLDLDSQSLGLDREDLENKLQQGLERLGLSTSITVRDLYDQINSNNLDKAIAAKKRWNDAINASDAWAGFYPGQAASMGPPSAPEREYPGGGGNRVR